MNRIRTAVSATLLSTLLACGGVVVLTGFTWAAPQDQAGQQAPAPDNTKVNKRDQNRGEPTADQQKEDRADREMARHIRRAIMKDKSLSTNAHNCKVIVQNGMVTLKGPVKSDDEKRTIEAMATKVAGEGKVTNELEVKTD